LVLSGTLRNYQRVPNSPWRTPSGNTHAPTTEGRREMAAEEKGVQANKKKESTKAEYEKLKPETEDKLRLCASALKNHTAMHKDAVRALRELLTVELMNELKEKKMYKKNQNKGITTNDMYNLLCYYDLTWGFEKFRICHKVVKDKQKDAELVNVKAENEVLKAENEVLKTENDVLKADNKGEKKTDEPAPEPAPEPVDQDLSQIFERLNLLEDTIEEQAVTINYQAQQIEELQGRGRGFDLNSLD